MGARGEGTSEQPWVLKTPSGGSEYEAYRDETLDLRPLSCGSAKPNSAITSDVWTTCTPC
jgi:hypothetical protein